MSPLLQNISRLLKRDRSKLILVTSLPIPYYVTKYIYNTITFFDNLLKYKHECLPFSKNS